MYESKEDFERIVLSNPHSSLVWIKYMSFLVSQTEVEAARAVAERALKTIALKKEDERFNVWSALLNLEHKFGSSASAWETLKRIVAHSEPKEAYLKAADMYSAAKSTNGQSGRFWQPRSMRRARVETCG